MSTSQVHRGTWLAIVLLGAVLGTVVVGAVFYLFNASPLVTLVTAGAAFTAMTGLGMKMYEFLSP